MSETNPAPLKGVRMLEMAGLGPAPFAAMLLADLGAEVLRIDRQVDADRAVDILNRGRPTLHLNLKDKEQVRFFESIVDEVDILLEGFRPGVMERLGLGPDVLCNRNERLIYARLTGWGQEGPLAHTAGHDINFIALAGALAPIGPSSAPPAPPLNLVGDFGGGALYAALGIVSALHERSLSGQGQVIDAAMVDGTASLLAMYLSHQQGGRPGTGLRRGEYFLDGSAPFYRCYECADGRHVAVGAIEPQFWRELLRGLGLTEDLSQSPETWCATSQILSEVFRAQSRDAWVRVFDGTDACVSPVLTQDELTGNAHLGARQTYLNHEGVVQPGPAPRFSRSCTGLENGPTAQQRVDEWLMKSGSLP